MAAKPGQRVPVSSIRMIGKLMEWKGKFGWIVPSTPINHPEARKHGGKVYLSQIDVEAEISGVGATVSFLVYADGTGLGAMHCRPAGVPGVARSIQKSCGRPSMPGLAHSGSAAAANHMATAQRGPGTAAPGVTMRARPVSSTAPLTAPSGPRQVITNASINGEVISFSGQFGWIKALEPITHPLYQGKVYFHSSDIEGTIMLSPGQKVHFLIYQDSNGLGASRVSLLEDYIGGDWEHAVEDELDLCAIVEQQVLGAEGAGPMLDKSDDTEQAVQREHVAETIGGEVLEWRKTFGWIQPHEEIDHPLAKKRGGRIYVRKSDVLGEEDLEVGQIVSFNIYADSGGLGAEEVVVL
jgi:cold shock CspA family protein